MHRVTLAAESDWDGWRKAARALALGGVAPDDVAWSVRAPGDPAAEDDAASASGTFSVPRALVELARTVIQARDPVRFALLYRLLLRAHAGERPLLESATDPDVLHARRLAQAVQRDTHVMRALIRFHEIAEADGVRHVAWFEPAHYIIEANAAYFAQRCGGAPWSVLTPYCAAHGAGDAVRFTAGVARANVPDDDAPAADWGAFFRNHFDPAALETGAARFEMPHPSPQTAGSTSPLAAAAREAAGCRACALWERATQTVFGEGPADASLMFIGEQPGDQEDLAGRPFVGPAGQLLDTALAEAGIDRTQTYVTNAVKHFKFEQRGKRRIHAKPDSDDIAACKFWLDLERQTIKPALTVLLGATAARAVLGRTVTISRERGRPIALDGNSQALVTVHPSYLLRLPDEDSRRREYAAFVADLRYATTLLTA